MPGQRLQTNVELAIGETDHGGIGLAGPLAKQDHRNQRLGDGKRSAVPNARSKHDGLTAANSKYLEPRQFR